MSKRKSLLFALSSTLMFCGILCQMGCRKAAPEIEKSVEQEAEKVVEKSRTELPKPGMATEAGDKEKTHVAFSEHDEMSQRIEDKLQKCSVGSMKGVVTKATKAAVDAASEASKMPGATKDSIMNAALVAAILKASDEGGTIPQEMFSCAVEEPIGRVIAICGADASGCYEQNYMRSE